VTTPFPHSGEPDWDARSHSLALHISCPDDRLAFYLILNAYWETLEFALPRNLDGTQVWRRWIDTSLDSPNDIVDWSDAAEVRSSPYQAAGRSVAVLFASAS
jgi:glycogen operon protein